MDATSIAVLTANLGNFDTAVDPPKQSVAFTFKRWTDADFPPITGLTPRLQYRIPKTHGWQICPNYQVYMWLDGTFTLAAKDSLEWFLSELGEADILVFRHPWRKTVREEVQHIEQHLAKNKPYITARYKNGLHKEQWWDIMDKYPDTDLYTSTAFMYRNTPNVQEMMKEWLYTSVRYFSCDQIVFPYLLNKYKLKVKVIEQNQYKFKHLKEVSKHE